MKKQNLKLSDLKVKSFITELDRESRLGALMGGGKPEVPELPTMPYNCSAVDACVTIRVCATQGGQCVPTGGAICP